jgi:hypothetical protein
MDMAEAIVAAIVAHEPSDDLRPTNAGLLRMLAARAQAEKASLAALAGEPEDYAPDET